MIRKIDEKITEEEFESIILDFDNKIDNYIKEKIITDYLAFYIATAYKENALWEGYINQLIGTALENLVNYINIIPDFNKIKEILKTKYKLELKGNNILTKIDIEEL